MARWGDGGRLENEGLPPGESGRGSDFGLLRPGPGGKLLVFCPGGISSGGPELLHQLVWQARLLGVDADVVYYPFDRPWSVPFGYRRYVEGGGVFRDAAADVIVVPEAATGLIRAVSRARKIIWWLSFDNYYRSFRGRPDRAPALNAILRWVHGFRAIGEQLGWAELRKAGHLTQSHYAGVRLREFGIEAVELSDFLRNEYLQQSPSVQMREPVVAYYPLKGGKISRRIIKSLPDVEFRAIVGMEADAVLKLMRSCSVYMDFGHHPGKDRLPREAAISGACIVTGRRGSAADPFDVPIPAEYKLDDCAPDFLPRIGALLQSICAEPGAHVMRFEAYRQAIMAEPERFTRRLRTLVGVGERSERQGFASSHSDR